MKRPLPPFGVSVLLLLIGATTLVRFSENLFRFCPNARMVDVFGLSGGGAACGAAVFGFVFALIAGNRADS